MDKLYEDAETGCCPRFDPEPWNEKEIILKNRLFIKDQVRSFLHIPIGFGKAIVKNAEKIKNADALTLKPFMLSDEGSAWKTNIYIEISKEVPGAEMTKISGKFLTKVFEGHYKNMRNWINDMEKYVKSKDKEIKKMYFFYTTCPHCAEVYGKNYTVILAEV